MFGSFDCSSPFSLSAGDSAALEQHHEALRSHRRGNVDSSSLFCPFHREECSEQQRADFQLHRDVVAALILPLFEIHRQATQIATRVLGRRQATEPERAFRGEARGAFAWLHCILTEEREFCLAQGCPACVVLHVLSSEPTIRLVTMACLLCEIVSSAEYTDFTQTHLLRPNFNCWLHAMESAVRADSLWGDLYWPEIRHRAESLAVDIRYLILQCVELRNGSTELQRTSSTTSITSACGSTSTSTGCSGNGSATSNKSFGSMAVRSDRQSYRVHMRSAIPLQPSALTRRQLNMVWEEQELVSRFLQGYWGSLCWSDRRQKMLEFSKTGSLYLPGKTT